MYYTGCGQTGLHVLQGVAVNYASNTDSQYSVLRPDMYVTHIECLLMYSCWYLLDNVSL